MSKLEIMIKNNTFPDCIIYQMQRDKAVRFERLKIHGMESMHCPSCKKYNTECEVYVDWLANKYLLEKE